MVEKVEENAALIIVDVLNDFCPGGALPVPEGDQVVPVINKWVEELFENDPKRIFALREKHPPVTSHFKEYGGLWPAHGVDGTPGAEFHPDLKLPEGLTIISKGMGTEEDAYSGFDGVTEKFVPLEDELHQRGFQTLYICGLATDYCVKETVLDALKKGFKVKLIVDACRAVNISPDDGEKAIKEMVEAGAELI